MSVSQAAFLKVRAVSGYYSLFCSSPPLASFKSILLHLRPSPERACCLPCKREIIFGRGGKGAYSQGRALPEEEPITTVRVD